MRDQQPKTIIFWGRETFSLRLRAGKRFCAILPKAEMHRLDSGHFAVEDLHDYIAERMIAFYDKNVRG